MPLTLIVAMTPQRIIGRNNQLPWRLSSDLRRFKRLTMGGALMMGRKTWESIGRPLPGRTSIVLTRQLGLKVPGAQTATDLNEAVRLAEDKPVFVMGGGEVYREALPRADRLIVTLVEANLPGDVSFPRIDLNRWDLREDTPHVEDYHNEYDYRYQRYITRD